MSTSLILSAMRQEVASILQEKVAVSNKWISKMVHGTEATTPRMTAAMRRATEKGGDKQMHLAKSLIRESHNPDRLFGESGRVADEVRRKDNAAFRRGIDAKIDALPKPSTYVPKPREHPSAPIHSPAPAAATSPAPTGRRGITPNQGVALGAGAATLGIGGAVLGKKLTEKEKVANATSDAGRGVAGRLGAALKNSKHKAVAAIGEHFGKHDHKYDLGGLGLMGAVTGNELRHSAHNGDRTGMVHAGGELAGLAALAAPVAAKMMHH